MPDSYLGLMERNVTGKLVAHEITPGEFFDRLTILELKADKLHGDKLMVVMDQMTHLTKSRRGQQLQYMRQTTDLLRAEIAQLQQANSDLWDIEDSIRDLDRAVFHGAGPRHLVEVCHLIHDDTPSITDELLCYVELARSVYVTNDLRNAAKRAIDQHFNVPPEVKEYKSYGEEDSEARQHQPGHA